MRSRTSGVTGNPVLIGAATLLVVLVAVFLSYNANQGLPFVPTYDLKAELPDAANLVRGNDVRIGGARVGAIDDLSIRTLPNGRNIAVVSMKLDAAVEELPVDSTILVRPKSLLGLKYVEITRGTAQEGYQNGGTMPLGATRPQVEFDELINTFDAPTRDAVTTNTTEFANALAGRSGSLNQAIGAMRPLLRDLVPVARNLADPETGLRRFVTAAARAAAAVAPVAETQAQLFGNVERTFAALAEVSRAYQETIEEGPATLEQGVESFRRQRPFLANSERLMAELRPGVRALRSAAPDLADAMRVGEPALERSLALSRRLEPLLVSLERFAEDPLVPRGVEDLTEALTTLRPTLEFAAPAQTTCNYLALWFRNVASLLSEGDASGTWQRFIIVAPPQGPNNEGGPSSAPANGPGANYLHTNPYPNTAAPGQPRECEAGHEGWIKDRTVIGNVPGTQPATTEGTP